MTIEKIYEKYDIPFALRTHMLRVGALTQIILDNWKGGEVDTSATVIASLLHDMAKPIMFDLSKQAEFGMTPEQINNLAAFQKRLIKRYGKNEHKVLLGIMKELNCNSFIFKIVSSSEWSQIPEIVKENNMESIILVYSDMRIAPSRILPIQDRIEDLKKRSSDEDFVEHQKNAKELEKIIQNAVSIDLSAITNQQLEERFTDLLKIDLRT